MIQKPVYKVYKDSILTEKINQPVKKTTTKKNNQKQTNTVMLNGSKVEWLISDVNVNKQQYLS